MRILGPIVRLQVQRSSLKVGFKPDRHYTPEPLASVAQLRLTPRGAFGLADEGEIIDVHHRDHPQTKQGRDQQGLSVGFTSHYAAMRDRFGEHMMDGVAGENVIVQTPSRVSLDDLQAGMAVLDRDGNERIRIQNVCVAHPCRPFSGFVHRGVMVEPEVLKSTLQFLDDGTRGFYCVPVVSDAGGVIRIGDVLATL